MKKYLPLLLLASCAGASTQSDFPDSPQVWGSLRGMMHKGLTDTGVSVNEAVSSANLWGVGAVKDLDGEITVMNSTSHLAFPVAGSDDVVYQATTDSNRGTALLVLAQVDEWVEIPIDKNLRSQVALEEFVANAAKDINWNKDEILPFRVKGTCRFLQLHVIDGRRLEGAGNSHEEHLATAIKNQWKNEDAELIGFRSLHHKAIFTHHDTTIHVHGLTSDNNSGHVDELAIAAGQAVLLVPKN